MRILILSCVAAALLSESVSAEQIDISGVPRVHLIQRLFRRAKVNGLGVLQNTSGELSAVRAKALVGKNINYLDGKVMKINVPAEGEGDTFESVSYDRDNGYGAARSVVDAIRAEGAQTKMSCDRRLAKPEKPELEFGELSALSNGTRAPTETIRSVSRNLFELSESIDLSDQIALHEIVMKCRNQSHQFIGEFVEVLIQRGFVNPDGTIEQDVKNIVLSAMKGDPLYLRFESPLFGAN